MGKVTFVKSCRKEQKCRKCGVVIPVGSSYYKGALFREQPIVRCTKCGLKHYEVTTSEYVKTIGRLVEDWEEDFGVTSTTVEEVLAVLEEMRDTCQENLDNIPEQLQEAEAGALLQERIDELESAIYELESKEWSEFLSDAYDELDEEVQAIIDAEQEKRNGADFEDWYEEFCENAADESQKEAAGCWQEKVEENVVYFLDATLENLSY